MATRTFLFVDQVRSTEQLTRLGDQAAQEVRRALFDLLRQATQLHGGHEVDFTGDGLFCAFEGAVEAVDAAVAMQQLVHSFNRRTAEDRQLAIRIGLNTGEPLESEGGGYFGAAVVIAARLCSSAEEGRILAADVVRALVESHGRHTFEPIGPLALKGVPAPVPVLSVAWQPDKRRAELPPVLAASIGEGAGGRTTTGATRAPFVGRARELDALRQTWTGVLAGGRRLALISGDHGIGVTRFAAEVARQVSADGAAVWYGSGHGEGARLAPWAHALTTWAQHTSRAELRLASGSKTSDLLRLAPGMAQLLPRTPAPPPMDAGAEVFLIGDALDELVTRWSGYEPMLVVLDSLEEADPASLTVLRRLIESDRGGRLLALACYEPAQIGTPRVLAALNELDGLLDVRLEGLDRAEIEQLITAVTGREVPAASLRAVANETEGSPYFVLQMATGLRERDLNQQVGEAVTRAEALRTDLRLQREEISLGLRQLDQLRDSEALAVESAVEPDGTPPAPVGCPYKGLVSFQPDDAADFFGRELLVSELVAKLVSARFLAVLGPSGSGKSSVLRAGLLPALAAGAVPGSATWVPAICTPGSRPIEQALDEARQAAHGNPVLLLVDQFEELWTADETELSAAGRAAVLDHLITAIDDPDHETVVVVSMRVDYYGRTAEHPRLAALMSDSQVLVPPMTTAQLRLAIEGPARKTGLILETGLAQAVIDDGGAGAGRLPLLSTAMLETWHRRRGRSLTLGGYAESGGARRAIAQLAETSYQQLSEQEQEAARRLLLRMASPGEDGDDVARPAALAELTADDVSRRVLTLLADRRLVSLGSTTAQVAHEALLREWPRLRGWLDADRQGRRLQHQIAAQAAEWDGGGRDGGLLLRGARLAAASDWAAGHDADLTSVEHDFVTASNEARQGELRQAQRQVRRFQYLSVGLVILLVGAMVALGFGVLQRRTAVEQATVSDARGLAAQALALSGAKTDTALLLAVEGYRRNQSIDTEGGLLSALNGARYMTAYRRGLPLKIYDMSLTPDRKTLVTLTADGTIGKIDTTTWKPIGGPLVSGLKTPTVLQVSQDGRLVTYGDAEGAHVIELATGRPVGKVYGSSAFGTPQFNHDATALVVGNQTAGGVRVYRIADGRLLTELGTDPGAFDFAGINSRKDELVVSSGQHRTLRRYGFDGRPLGKPVALPDAVGSLNGFTFYPKGNRFVAGGFDGDARLFDATTLKPVGEPFRVRGSRVIDVAVQPSAEFVAAAGDDGSVRIVGADTGYVYSTLSGLSGGAIVEYLDDDRLIVSTSTELVEFNTRTLAQFGPSYFFDGPVWSTSKLTDRTVLVSQTDKTATVSADLTQRTDFPALSFAPNGAEVSPDRRMMAVHGATEDGKARVAFVDIASKKRLREVAVPAERQVDEASMAFSPDGRRLALGTRDSGALVVIDVQTGSLVVPGTRIDFFAPRAVGWSQDSASVYFGGQSGVLSQVDAATGEVRRSVALSEGEELDGVVQIPGTSLIAVSSEAGFVYFVDTGTFTQSGAPLSAGGTQLQNLDVTPDGTRIAAVSRDGAVRIWDVASRRQVGPALAAHDVQASAIAFLDDTRLVTGSYRSTLSSWNLDPASWVKRACELAGRDLTQAEWQQYLPDRPYRKTCSDGARRD